MIIIVQFTGQALKNHLSVKKSVFLTLFQNPKGDFLALKSNLGYFETLKNSDKGHLCIPKASFIYLPGNILD